MKKIMLLGSGELGKEFVIAAQRSAMPSRATRRMTWFIMSPEPAITKRTSGTRLSTLAAASTK